MGLQHYNIPRKLVSLITKSIQQGSKEYSESRVWCFNGWFNQIVGVKQGCILSPDLFHVFLEHILNEALRACKGDARINGHVVYQTYDFADDIDLMGENTQDAQDILNSVHTWSQTYGLEISKEKTKSWSLQLREKMQYSSYTQQVLKQVSHFQNTWVRRSLNRIAILST